MKEKLAEYFTFSRKERIGIIVLLALAAFTGVVPALIPDDTAADDSLMIRNFRKQLAMLDMNPPDSFARFTDPLTRENQPWRETRGKEPSGSPGSQAQALSPTPVLFSFDPNSLDDAGWVSLGVRERTVRTIRNFQAKGGQFRKPEDLLKLYGLSDADKQRLLPFVRIEKKDRPVLNAPTAVAGQLFSREIDERPQTWRKKNPVKIDINLADTLQWQQLPGIGSKLAERIVKFRDRLGGFMAREQVSEVYGIEDSVFRKILPWLVLETKAVKIAVNLIDAATLAKHPYCGTRIARAITDYRDQHGLFSNLAEFEQIAAIPATTLAKLVPYLEMRQK